MKYIALLRGINVGGNKSVEMSRLKALFEGLGYTDVKTYINSGNVIFSSSEKDQTKLCQELEEAIENEFGFVVPAIIKSVDQIKAIASAIPVDAQNNTEMKCDVLFLWDEVDSADVFKDLDLREGVDQVKYIPGAIIWSVKREDINKSRLLKIVGTPFYKKVTIRNCNTVRRLNEITAY